MDRKPDLRNDEIRGEAARQLLANELLVEAFAAIEGRIVSQLRLADLEDERRKRLNDLLVALAKVKLYIEQVAVSGTMAAQEIERQRSIAERVTERVRRFGAY